MPLSLRYNLKLSNYASRILGMTNHPPPGGSEWIISVGDYVNNSLTALGSSDPREVRLEL